MSAVQITITFNPDRYPVSEFIWANPDLVEQLLAARLRTFLARHGGECTEQPADYWQELRLGTELAREATAGRWCVVADLLRLGAVESWAAVGEALDMTETDARDGFSAWITSQWDLYRRTGTLGFTAAEAEELHRLAETVA